MKRCFFFLFLLAGCFLSLKMYAQKDTGSILKLNLQQAKFIDMVAELEKQSHLYFYYDIKSVDSLFFSINIENQPIDLVLQTLFASKDIYYTMDADQHVFVTKGNPLSSKATTTFIETQPGNIREQTKQTITPQAISTPNAPLPPAEVVKLDETAMLENKLFEIGNKPANGSQEKFTLAGYIKDAKTGSPLSGASISVDNTKITVATDQYGFYSITLPKGKHVLNVLSYGKKDTRRQFVLNGDGKLNIDLSGVELTLKSVVISAQKISNVKGTQMGLQKIDIKTIKQVPVVFGEADILRVVTTLPGVKTVGEASTGLNVRGGSADQNLILFNDATIYNPAHFFGMFSAFNPELVKDVELYKSSIPARYGGRLASVLNINGREGNKKDIAGSAGIGLLTSRFNIEGPLVKEKSSFLLGARTTYARWLLNLLPDQYKNSRASFYDVNLNITHELNARNTVYLTGYLSEDDFNLNSDTVYGYGNKNLSLKWKHVFNNKFNALVTGGLDHYQYAISSRKLPVSAYRLGFKIDQAYFKSHFTYYHNNQHTIEFGLNAIRYSLNPGLYEPVGSESLVKREEVKAEQGLESALYISDRFNISKSFTADGGIRYSMFNFLGPKNINNYAPGLPKTESNQIGTVAYGKGDFIKTYSGPEFRFSLRYAFNDSFSIKAGFNTQRQYIHSISNTASMAPTDIWKLSDPNIKPQYGEQVSLGLYKNFKSNTIETSVEVYYKKIQNFLDYKSGARLVMNDHLETDVFGTKGKAYGVELLVKKLSGKLNGWISYTWSRILLKMDDPLAGEIINKGNYYPANYDKPHDITIIGNYRITHRFSVSVNATYSTGRPITLPIGVFYFTGTPRTLYADRNAYRIPDYFRSDLSMNIDGNHKVHQRFHNSWTVGVYNLTGRKNPYSVYYVSENGFINGYKLSIFGRAIPFINYNITF